MLTLTIKPTFIQQCLAEREGGVDTEAFLEALEYVRDDGRSNR